MTDVNDIPPHVSVIVGTYNAARYLRETMDSIWAQSFKGLEIIVVDDASTDNTLEMLKGFGDRIRVIRRATNSATCELPRYQGAAQARGKYCAFLDADDTWTPDKLEKQVRWMEEHPDVPLSHTYMRMIDEDSRPLHVRHDGMIPPTGRIARELLRHCFITISSVVVRREVWLAALREEDIREFSMDWDFFLTIAREHPIGFLPEVLGFYRRSPQSVSVHRWRRLPRNVATMERLYRRGLWAGVASRGDMRRILAEAYHENAEHHRHLGYPGRALWFAERGLRHRPWSGALWTASAKALAQRLARGL